MFISRRRQETGATAVEYALLVVLVAAVIIAAVMILGNKTVGLFSKPCVEMANVGQPC